MTFILRPFERTMRWTTWTLHLACCFVLVLSMIHGRLYVTQSLRLGHDPSTRRQHEEAKPEEEQGESPPTTLQETKVKGLALSLRIQGFHKGKIGR